MKANAGEFDNQWERATVEVLQRDTAIDTVLEAIRTSILDGTSAPGSQLKQSVIAARLGVSQGPVREALGHLVEEGLVENIPYRGMFVRRLTTKDIEEIYEMRAALECLAARLGLNRIWQDRSITKFEELVERAMAAGRLEDCNAAVQADLNFHSYLVELSGNSRLIKVWNSLLAQSHYLLRNLYALQLDKTETLAANHRTILDALRSGDIAMIEQVIEGHMNFAKVILLEHWTEVSGGWSGD